MILSKWEIFVCLQFLAALKYPLFYGDKVVLYWLVPAAVEIGLDATVHEIFNICDLGREKEGHLSGMDLLVFSTSEQPYTLGKMRKQFQSVWPMICVFFTKI